MTPSDQLAARILPLLVEDKLVLLQDTAKYQTKLAAGQMKAEDWLMLAENAADKEAQS